MSPNRIRRRDIVMRVLPHEAEVFRAGTGDPVFEFVGMGNRRESQRRHQVEEAPVGQRVGVDYVRRLLAHKAEDHTPLLADRPGQPGEQAPAGASPMQPSVAEDQARAELLKGRSQRSRRAEDRGDGLSRLAPPPLKEGQKSDRGPCAPGVVGEGE